MNPERKRHPIKGALVLACVLAGIGLYILLRPPKTPAPPAVSTPPAASLAVNAAPIIPPPAVPLAHPSGTSAAPAELPTPVRPGTDYSAELLASAPSTIAPATVLENVRTAVRQYGSTFGGNPVGTNPEITAALNGGNPKQARFLDPEMGMRINAKGELVDPWGTPYFFHQLSGTDMEIRSAGPDKRMWTPDDLVTR